MDLLENWREELVWDKFPADLFGCDLKIALESNFPVGIELVKTLIPEPKKIPGSMNYYDKHTPVVRFYNPAATFVNDGVLEIFFGVRFKKEGEILEDEKIFKRFMFKRKTARGFPREGRLPMMAGRFGEDKPFGFSCQEDDQRGHPNYLPLAMPGRVPSFIPVYFRIETYPEPTFLKIEAQEDEENNVIKVIRVNVDVGSVPENLL